MASKTFTIEFDGDLADSATGFIYALGVYGSLTLGKCRVKKSSAGGTGRVNIDCASPVGKSMDVADLSVDINPLSLADELADGDSITDIPNSADGSSIVAASGNEPEWMSSGDFITGFPAIDFVNTGGDERLILPSPAPSFASGEEFSIALVIDNGNNNNKPLLGSDVGSASRASMYGTGSNRNIMIQDESGNLFESTAGSSTNMKNKDIHIAVRLSNDRVSCWRRGVEIITGQDLSGTFSPSIIGNARQSNSWNGNKANFARILIVGNAWTDEERQYVEGWLAWKYGLQTSSNSYLPSTHPYYQGTSPITPYDKAYTTSFDLSSLAADTWTDADILNAPSPNDSTIASSIKIYMENVYKIGTVTVQMIVDY